MKAINFKREVRGSVEDVIQRTTEALQTAGFGVLTRIDFHSKIKEKLGKNLPPVVVLGACNPKLAFEAYSRNTDVASLIPCNAVVRETGPGECSVELMKPSAMMEILGDAELARLSQEADTLLRNALESI